MKDAEFRPNGRSGVYGGYQDWQSRPGRFRSLGDGQIDFKQIFSKLTQYGFDGWAVLEWECSLERASVDCSQRMGMSLVSPGPARLLFLNTQEKENRVATHN